MILPERHHAAQQIGAAKHGTVQNGGAADHDVAAASRGVVAAAVVELLGGQAIAAGLFVEDGIDLLQFIPIACRGED